MKKLLVLLSLTFGLFVLVNGQFKYDNPNTYNGATNIQDQRIITHTYYSDVIGNIQWEEVSPEEIFNTRFIVYHKGKVEFIINDRFIIIEYDKAVYSYDKYGYVSTRHTGILIEDDIETKIALVIYVHNEGIQFLISMDPNINIGPYLNFFIATDMSINKIDI